jgi:hypothetical protein
MRYGNWRTIVIVHLDDTVIAHLYTLALTQMMSRRRPKRIGRFGSIIGWTPFHVVTSIRHGVEPEPKRQCT